MEGTRKRKLFKRMTMSVKCMIFHENKILLLRKKDREGIGPWEFPGGGLEFGENLHDAAIREVKEETGLAIDLLDIAGLWSFKRTESIFLTGVIFIARAHTKDIILSEEHSAYAWVTPKEMASYHLQDSLQTALQQIRMPDENGSNLRRYFVKNYKR